MIIEYHRLRPDVVEPTRANPSDAGLDVYFSPVHKAEGLFRVEPGKNHMFPTGLKFGIPHGYMLQVCNRSSMGGKKSLVVGAHIIDSGYDGEVFIDLHNIGDEPQLVAAGDKIAQLILVPVIHFRPVETEQDNLYEQYPIAMSERGEGALGSTDVEPMPHPLDGMPSGF
tara:strand:- start:649 stop:1155 length:507 start_codon:yes stop_codon:yes gene_type:complete